jgi:hypothetical protein
MESLRVLESPDKGSDGGHCLGKVRLNTINHKLQKLVVSLSEVLFSFKSRQRAPRLFHRILTIRWKLIGKFLGVARHLSRVRVGQPPSRRNMRS